MQQEIKDLGYLKVMIHQSLVLTIFYLPNAFANETKTLMRK